jgi:hypothetical protein
MAVDEHGSSSYRLFPKRFHASIPTIVMPDPAFGGTGSKGNGEPAPDYKPFVRRWQSHVKADAWRPSGLGSFLATYRVYFFVDIQGDDYLKNS